MSKQDGTIKSIFNVTVEWSDHSPHSPTRTGQLPLAAIVGNGRVGITCQDIQIAQYNRNIPYNSWVKMGHGVSARESGWGDNGGRSYGRSGATVEILAPEETVFIFEQGCNSCGDTLGEIPESDLVHNRAPEVICEDCLQIKAEQDRLVKEQHQEITFSELEQRTGVKPRSLVLAASKGNLEAHKSGGTWLASVAAVDDAIAQGYIRAPKKENRK